MPASVKGCAGSCSPRASAISADDASGCLGAELQYAVEGLTAAALGLGQRGPGAGEDFVPPTGDELPVRVGRFVVRLGRIGHRRLQRPRQPPLPPLVIDDQVIEHRLQVAAEAAAAGIGVGEGPLHHAQGELLEQLVGRIGVAEAPSR